jgi:large subunit ribosomal protein L23
VTKQVHNVLIKPVLTEKVVAKSQENNTYAFEVSLDANKIEIRAAVQKAFKVKVLRVRTSMRRGGTRRFGYKRFTEAPVKRAYVTLAEGDRIDLL